MTSQQIQDAAKRAAKRATFMLYSEQIIADIIASEFLPLADNKPVEQILSAAREVVQSNDTLHNCTLDEWL